MCENLIKKYHGMAQLSMDIETYRLNKLYDYEHEINYWTFKNGSQKSDLFLIFFIVGDLLLPPYFSVFLWTLFNLAVLLKLTELEKQPKTLSKRELYLGARLLSYFFSWKSVPKVFWPKAKFPWVSLTGIMWTSCGQFPRKISIYPVQKKAD